MKKKILVVDDSKAMRLIVRRTLRQANLPDHEVVEATNGKEALDLIMQGVPDLVLSDWNMPEMNGFELLTELRKRAINVKFGFITTEGTKEMRDSAACAGALFLIAKPFTADDFQQTIAPVLQ